MNDLVISRAGGAANLARYADALGDLQFVLGADNDGKPILRLKDGEWVAGEERIVIEKDDLLAVQPLSFRRGYVAFHPSKNELALDMEGNPADMLWPLGQEVPFIEDLPELEPVRGKKERGQGGAEMVIPRWQQQVAIDMVVVEGPNEGLELVYKPTSMGGMKLVKKLAAEIARKVRDGDPQCVPLVELLASSYHNRTWGKDIDVPLAEIVAWAGMDDVEVPAAEPAKGNPKKGEKTAKGHDVDTRKPAPAPTRRKAPPAPEPEDEADEVEEDEPEEKTPARGRRSEPAPARGRDKPAPQTARSRRAAPDVADEDEGAEEDEQPAQRTRGRRDDRDRDVERRQAAAEPAGPRGRGAASGGRAAPAREPKQEKEDRPVSRFRR